MQVIFEMLPRDLGEILVDPAEWVKCLLSWLARSEYVRSNFDSVRPILQSSLAKHGFLFQLPPSLVPR